MELTPMEPEKPFTQQKRVTLKEKKTDENKEWLDVHVTKIDMEGKPPCVTLSNEYTFTHKEWFECFVNFWDNRIIGKSIVPIFYEYLFAKGGSNAHEQLMKGQKHEGFMLGSMDKIQLSKGTKIAIGAVLSIIMIMLLVFIVLKNQGMLPGL